MALETEPVAILGLHLARLLVAEGRVFELRARRDGTHTTAHGFHRASDAGKALAAPLWSPRGHGLFSATALVCTIR